MIGSAKAGYCILATLIKSVLSRQGCPIKIMLRGVGKSSLKDYTSCFTKQGVSDGQLKATRLSLSF